MKYERYPTFFYFLVTCLADNTAEEAFEIFMSLENEERKKALTAEAAQIEKEDIYEITNYLRRNYRLNLRAKLVSYIISMIRTKSNEYV